MATNPPWLILIGVVGLIGATTYYLSRRLSTYGSIKQLTYADAIRLLKEIEPKPPVMFERAAIVRKSLPTGKLRISLVFHDKKGDMVRTSAGRAIGKSYDVKMLDQELQELFGDSDVIFVE